MNYLIDPTKITNYNQTDSELQIKMLFWVFAAGHNAQSTAKGIDKFLTETRKIVKKDYLPFNLIDNLTDYQLLKILSKSGLGCWRIKSRTIRELIEKKLNLRTCSVEDLEEIYNIGEKTSRCFVLHSRKNARVAGLDTHILKFLNDQGIEVPKSRPTGKKYKVLEQEFLRLCDEAGKEPAVYDLEIWNKYRKKPHRKKFVGQSNV